MLIAISAHFCFFFFFFRFFALIQFFKWCLAFSTCELRNSLFFVIHLFTVFTLNCSKRFFFFFSVVASIVTVSFFGICSLKFSEYFFFMSNRQGGGSKEDMGHTHKRARENPDEGIESLLDSIQNTVVYPLKHHLDNFCELDKRARTLTEKRDESLKSIEKIQQKQLSALVTFNVGGELFTFPKTTLLSSDDNSLFHALFYFEGDPVVPIQKDENGVIFFDRDPNVFRHIANYLRGYTKFDKLEGSLAKRIHLDAIFFRLPKLLKLLDADKKTILQFRPGPGVSPDGDRLRVAFGVAIVGEEEMVTGRHSITFEILLDEYIGVGIVSDACTCTDREFHSTPFCCVYYMSGVFYNNYPHHKKEERTETIVRFRAGDRITIDVDLDKGIAEFINKNGTKIVSIGKSKRLRFAITAKGNSSVRIV